jgi:hopanoid biosynthesis associated protein HpnK
MTRLLIINGDDFGSSHEVNQGIETAHEQGILTSASLMVGGRAVEEAVCIAKKHPDLGVGIHLTLVQGYSVLPPHQISGLVNAPGGFPHNPVTTGFRYFFQKNLHSQLSREIEAQIEQFLSFGLYPTHVDGHLNMHLHPVVIEQVLKLCARYHIRCLRIPKENLGLHLRLDRKGIWGRVAHWIIFEIIRRGLKQRVQNQGLITADQTFGLLQSGRLYQSFVLKAIEHLPAGVTEMGFHPFLSREREDSSPPGGEMDALLSPKVARRIRELGIELCHF